MKKKLLSLLLALAMVFTLVACGEKKPAPGKDATATEPVVILHTNDVHGAIENYAKVAALADKYEAEGAYVLVLDAGDFSQGTTSVSLSQGATAIELMNMVGYDAVALGNHEFDYGYEVLKQNMASANFPVLAANVKYNGELAFDDAAVFTTPGGTKIGVFGLDTPETATKAHPGKIAGVTFAGGEEMYQIAQDMVTMLREEEGCNYVICIGHLGIDDETAVTANRSIDLLAKVTGIDVFIDGHSHSTEEEIVAAAKAAHADSFIRRLPEGYDTVIAEDGGNISQGQKQLLCIARVMLCLPPMLILDEATSSIDTRTEVRIQKAFARMMQGRTSFIVAHRLSTIKNADQILVMKAGNIIERGTHEELLKNCDVYMQIAQSQLSAKELGIDDNKKEGM